MHAKLVLCHRAMAFPALPQLCSWSPKNPSATTSSPLVNPWHPPPPTDFAAYTAPEVLLKVLQDLLHLAGVSGRERFAAVLQHLDTEVHQHLQCLQLAPFLWQESRREDAQCSPSHKSEAPFLGPPFECPGPALAAGAPSARATFVDPPSPRASYLRPLSCLPFFCSLFPPGDMEDFPSGLSSSLALPFSFPPRSSRPPQQDPS